MECWRAKTEVVAATEQAFLLKRRHTGESVWVYLHLDNCSNFELIVFVILDILLMLYYQMFFCIHISIFAVCQWINIMGSGGVMVREGSLWSGDDWFKPPTCRSCGVSCPNLIPPLRALEQGLQPQSLQWRCSVAADETVVVLGSFQVWMWNCVTVIRASLTKGVSSLNK